MGSTSGLGNSKIRRAKREDGARIAELSGELGYPTTTREMVRRLKRLLPAKESAVFVAEARDGVVIGWITVSVNHLLEVGTRAEINGLVVAEGQRSLGAGWRLLEEAERWAKRQKCKSMSVRSNVIRERAHGFYQRHGYEHYKTQKAFRKML
jgi:ribosomal protein S18 acetylase RimI-like enzyme